MVEVTDVGGDVLDAAVSGHDAGLFLASRAEADEFHGASLL
jgi:hypothetical protein